MQKTLASVLVAALILLSPGLGCYQALASPRIERGGASGEGARLGTGHPVPAVPILALSFLPDGIDSNPLGLFLGLSPAPLHGAAAEAQQRLSAPETLEPISRAAIERFAQNWGAQRAAGVLVGAESSTPNASTRKGLFAAATQLFGGKVQDRKASLDAAFDSGQVKVFITLHGSDPKVTTLSELGGVLNSNPQLKKLLNERSAIRVVLSKSPSVGELTSDSLAPVREALSRAGLQRADSLDTESVRVGEQRRSDPGFFGRILSVFITPISAGNRLTSRIDDFASRQVSPVRVLIKTLNFPFRETFYLADALGASFTTPTKSETTMGILFKFGPTMLGLGALFVLYTGHPVAFASIIALQLSVDLFYGVFVKTWSNFIDRLGKERGFTYQTMFNLLYGQFLMALFRTLSWSALHSSHPEVYPPWTVHYWADMFVITSIGTIIGTLAYPALLKLYNDGRLNRFWLALILQLRDLKMAVCGILWGAGLMFWYWVVFWAQQFLDVAFIGGGLKLAPRPVVYVVDDKVAATNEFKNLFPVGPATKDEPLLQKAWKTLLGIPLLAPITWPFKMANRWLRGKLTPPKPKLPGPTGTP